jgi:predicted Zn-dependent protease
MTPTRYEMEDALRAIRHPALRYADVRFTQTERQDVRTRNGKVEGLSAQTDRAVGVRVLVGDGWGFAASSVIDPDIAASS